MIESSSWRLPVRKVESTQNQQYLQNQHSEQSQLDLEGSIWTKDTTVERFNDKLFGGVGCIEYSLGGRFLAVSSRSQSLVLRLPLQSHHERATTGAAGSNCVWNEQLPRSCFTTRFRGDDKLVVQTVDQRIIVRSTETAFERTFDGHTRDVRDALFLTGQYLASVSDDATVRLWSLTQTSEIAVSAGVHTDYVRSLCGISEREFATGGYDRKVCMWDVRSDMRKAAQVFHLAHPVEKVAFSSQSNFLYAAAADVVALFDIRKASSNAASSTKITKSSSKRQHQQQQQQEQEGENEQGEDENNNQSSSKNNLLLAGLVSDSAALVSSSSFHTKTVSALALHSTANSKVTVLTGGLDKRIKIHRQLPDGTLRTIATRKAATGVTALAVNPEGNQFAVGTQDGYASAFDLVTAEDTYKASATAAAAASGSGGGVGEEGEGATRFEKVTADRGVAGQGKRSTIKESAAALRKERATAAWLTRIHALLTRYRYGLALKTALYSTFDDVVATTIDELMRRCALHVAISGHNDRTIVKLLRFVTDKVSDPKMTNTCLIVMDRVLEIYAGSAAAENEYFHRELLRCHHLLEELSAHIEHIRAASAIMELLVQS